MKFNVQLKHLSTGQWQVRYIGGKVETLNIVDEKKDHALERMRENIRYHLEYCP